MLIWVIECAECHGHDPIDFRGRWRPLQAAAGREDEAEFFCQIWACGVCNYGLLNASSRMGIINIFLCAERGAGPGEGMRSKDSTTLKQELKENGNFVRGTCILPLC